MSDFCIKLNKIIGLQKYDKFSSEIDWDENGKKLFFDCIENNKILSKNDFDRALAILLNFLGFSYDSKSEILRILKALKILIKNSKFCNDRNGQILKTFRIAISTKNAEILDILFLFIFETAEIFIEKTDFLYKNDFEEIVLRILDEAEYVQTINNDIDYNLAKTYSKSIKLMTKALKFHSVLYFQKIFNVALNYLKSDCGSVVENSIETLEIMFDICPERASKYFV
ncbi:hypothetical protein MHBO_001170, partial [Bonamia ostreae]